MEGMSATTNVDLSKHTLLCISDLEGCVANFGGKPQSQKLCETETFTAIGKLLETHNELQVAFLGDYFDQGDKMETSIAGIVGLKEHTTYGNRVHIILGNRDVNKMRICVEAFKTISCASSPVWSAWNDFLFKNCKPNGDNTGYDSTKLHVERCKQLLAKTYGAPELLNFAGNGNEQLGFNRMRAIFQKVADINPRIDFKEDEFVTNCRKLFYYGELIKVIVVGDKKVLVSHAGTNNANIFKLTDTSQIITDKSTLKYLPDNYFDSIEIARKALQTPLQSDLKFDDSIQYYNRLYKNLVQSIINAEGTIKDSLPQLLEKDEDARADYFLLQAMGLKADTSNTGNFLSPIESCGLSGGCKKFNEFPPDFGQLLNASKINAIAHGHIPFCGTVPLIHAETVKMEEGKEQTIGVLSCDTSNGNRPSAYDSLGKIPLGYIQESGIGIASIHSGKLSRANTQGFKNDGTNPDLYKPMVGHFNYEQLPTVNYDRNEITYGTTIFEFDKGKGLFKPLLQKPTTAGGKSRRKRRRGSKRKSGKKYSRKIRKVRYLKHKCSHGCRH
jgi:hypothetical protein